MLQLFLANVRSNTGIDTLFVHILLLCNNIVFGVLYLAMICHYYQYLQQSSRAFPIIKEYFLF